MAGHEPAAAGRDRSRWLTRNVAVLSGVSLAQDAASELMYPLLPILLTSVLGAPAAVVGLVEGVAEGVAAALKYVSGRISDRVGRKPAITAGYGLAAIGKVLVAAASVWGMVLVGRVVDRVGKGIRGAPRDALLAEGVPAPALGRAFGFHRAADTVGAVIGPLLGLAILQATGGDISTALWIAVVPAVLSVLLIGFVREAPKRRQAPVAGAAPHAAGSDRAGREAATAPRTPLPARVRWVAAMLGLFALVNFPDALILLRLDDLGFSASGLLAAYALFNLANAAIAYPAGALSDRWPRSRVYALGLACFAAGYLGLGLVTASWAAVLLLVLYGGFAGITEGVGRAWISALTPPAQRGHAQGLAQGLGGAGILVAGLWAGLLWDAGPGGGVVPLVLSGTVAAACAVGLAAFGRRLEPRGTPA
ncbi:MAG TPA: MFS transporter [Candidatus Nanopelagicales bacterium]